MYREASHNTVMRIVIEIQAFAWDVPSSDVGSGRHEEILRVARKGQLKGQHRGAEHGRTRTGRSHQSHASRSLPSKDRRRLQPQQTAIERRSTRV